TFHIELPMSLSDLIRLRGFRAAASPIHCRASSPPHSLPPAPVDGLDESLLADDLGAMELELRHRDAYLRSLGSPSAETVARSTLVTDSQVDQIMASEGPLDRLKDLYALNEDNEPSYELASVMLVSMATFTYLNVRYTVQERRLAGVSFEDRNKLTVFASKQQASRRKMDYITMRALRLGLKRSASSLIFAPLFLGGAQCISAVRGRSSPLDFLPSGIAAGACVRGAHGLQPMLGGAVLGGFLGAVVGTVVYGIQLYCGLTYEEMRRYRLTERSERDARLMAKLSAAREQA
ncbi:hypothetical protein BOX15_Mlig005337g1, partial [Macrostomum lignano]